jgi:copper chaperone CopZ
MTAMPADSPETIVVTGMTCSHCVQSVTKALTTLGGITDVQVDLGTGRVSYRNAGAVGRERIEDAVRRAGFEPQ